MKLYLSALGIPNTHAYLALFARKSPQHVVVVPTAWNVAPSAKSAPFIAATTAVFDGLGFTHETLDLATCTPASMHQALARATAIWITGGNTFYLNYWMRESGFDKLLPELLKRGVVYGGESAGAVVAGKTLHGIEILDDPADAPELIWPGLGLVDYGIIPHWDEQKYSDRLQQAYDEMRLFCPTKTLKNTEYIVLK